MATATILPSPLRPGFVAHWRIAKRDATLLLTGSHLELLLNLCWLLLLGPGAYLWLRQRRRAKPVFQFSIALACLLFLLFPVISATDDLHAFRQEMEESSPTKKALKQVAKRTTAPEFSAPPAQIPSAVSFPPSTQICGFVLIFDVPAPASERSGIFTSRAPPASLLA
jgi:HAMP domain-containing protein